MPHTLSLSDAHGIINQALSASYFDNVPLQAFARLPDYASACDMLVSFQQHAIACFHYALQRPGLPMLTGDA